MSNFLLVALAVTALLPVASSIPSLSGTLPDDAECLPGFTQYKQGCYNVVLNKGETTIKNVYEADGYCRYITNGLGGLTDLDGFTGTLEEFTGFYNNFGADDEPWPQGFFYIGQKILSKKTPDVFYNLHNGAKSEISGASHTTGATEFMCNTIVFGSACPNGKVCLDDNSCITTETRKATGFICQQFF